MQADSVALKVFLAEDSLPLRQRVADRLAQHGMDVVGAGDTPESCIAGIVASGPDVVVLDVHLEGGTGLQVLRAVRARRLHPAYVVFSNSTEPAYRKRYLAEGATRFLDKNTDFEELAGAVQAASRPTAH